MDLNELQGQWNGQCSPDSSSATIDNQYNPNPGIAVQSPCPHCGYCPHCGRGGYHTYPYWPYQPYWQIQTGGTITSVPIPLGSQIWS